MTEKNEQIREQENENQKSTDISKRPTAHSLEGAFAELERLMSSSPESTQSQSKEAHLSRDVKLYTDNMGRNHIIDEVQARGSFYVKPSTIFLVMVNVIIVPISGAVFFRLVAILTFPLWAIPGLVIILTVLTLAATAAVMFLTFLYCVNKIHGPLHKYKADGRAFFVTVKGKDKIPILYRDVLRVEYTPTKFLWFDRGYKVDIVTTYGTVHYDYIFPQFNQCVSLQDLPFDVIKRNIPNLDDADE